MSRAALMLEINKGPLFTVAKLHFPDCTPAEVPLATINTALVSMHPELEALFQEHAQKIVQVIVESMDCTLDEFVNAETREVAEAMAVKVNAGAEGSH